jgi:hypothetical protein
MGILIPYHIELNFICPYGKLIFTIFKVYNMTGYRSLHETLSGFLFKGP